MGTIPTLLVSALAMLRSIQAAPLHCLPHHTAGFWVPFPRYSPQVLAGSFELNHCIRSAGRWSRWAGPKPSQAEGTTTTSRTRPPSHRSAPNGRAALGPSASPHVAPPRAARPLADAGPSPRLAPPPPGARSARLPGAGSEVNGLE